MAFPTSQIATAARLIKKYGQLVTWRVVSDTSVADPTKPWQKNDASNVDHPISAVALSATRLNELFAQYMASQTNSSPNTSGKQAFLIAGNVGFVPSLKDFMVRGGAAYSPEFIEPIAPNGVPICYRIWFANAGN